MKTIAECLQHDCPKCGKNKEFATLHYREPETMCGDDCIEVRCSTCGYGELCLPLDRS